MSEDTSLDDFFAKKDKSKKKSKGKSTNTTSELLSQMEETHAKKQRQKRAKETENQAGLNDRVSDEVINTKLKENEDWQDFEEEKEKDYSGLRLQNLQINKETSDDQDEDQEEETQEDETESSSKTTRDLSQGPWKQSSTPAPVVAAPEPEKPKPKDETPKTGGKYVPPSMRGQQSNSSNTPSRRPLNKKSAPNISSEMDFPSLGGNTRQPAANNSEPIENPNQRGKLNLTLGNKFSALQN